MVTEREDTTRGVAQSVPRAPGPATIGGPGPTGLPHQDVLESIFPPIADYAFLSDCENSCLVAPNGAIEWFCIPKPQGPERLWHPARSSGGLVSFSAGRQPRASAPPVRTGHDGARNDLAVAQRLAHRERLLSGCSVASHQRALTSPPSNPERLDARHVLVRTVTCLHGDVDVVLNCEPSFDYGRVDAQWEYLGETYNQVQRRTLTNPASL